MKNKFVIILRHGKLSNPQSITYNRDNVMKPEDRIHLSKEGVEQIKKVGDLIKKNKFKVVEIWHSPQTRVIESKDALNSVLKIDQQNIKQELRIDEVYAPGVYKEGIDIKTWEIEMKSNAYDKKRWGKYHHEDQKEVIARFNSAFWAMAKTLKIGQTGILISHGDPIAWFINYLISGKIPAPEKLRELIYPSKGEAMVVVLNEKNKWEHYYELKK